ncbi:MAG: hypothetical protein GY738_04965, partial [Pseudoalteromonas sp.]|nr:hypothetical protein [Pseudoalteromonas sp.]
MKSMVAIIDSGSTKTLISARALMAMATQTDVTYSRANVQLVGVNGTTQSTGSVHLTGAYCPSPGEVIPFSVIAHIHPQLPVDLLIGNDLSEIVGLGLHDSKGRRLESVPLSSDQQDLFSAVTLNGNSFSVGVKEKGRDFAQRSHQDNVMDTFRKSTLISQKQDSTNEQQFDNNNGSYRSRNERGQKSAGQPNDLVVAK